MEHLLAVLQPYSRESVIYVCVSAAIISKMYQRSGFDKRRQNDFLVDFFDPVLASSLMALTILPEPAYVFHRRQLLFLTKEAIKSCPTVGQDLVMEPKPFGKALLMANDHFHFGLSSTDASEQLLNVLTEFVTVTEYAGFRLENKITRSLSMLLKIPKTLKDHPDFLDVAESFQELTRIEINDYISLWFGLLSKYVSLELPELQKDWSDLYINKDFFRTTKISESVVEAFLSELEATPEEIKNAFERRDYGTNDYTALRNKPLIREELGSLPSDLFFVMDKIETGPYWRVSGTSAHVGDRLRRFWGKVFERYVNDLLAETSDAMHNCFCPDPRYTSNPETQVCDGIMVCGDTLLLLEYKSSMFRADAKYSGVPELLKEEIERKLVFSEEGKPKGVVQLANAVKKLFCTNHGEQIIGVPLDRIRNVVPVLITLDPIGRTLLLTAYLNIYFHRELDGARSPGLRTFPILNITIEDLEVVSEYFGAVPFSKMLGNWCAQDPQLISTFLGVDHPELSDIGTLRNRRVQREFDEAYVLISQRLGFPQDGQ